MNLLSRTIKIIVLDVSVVVQIKEYTERSRGETWRKKNTTNGHHLISSSYRRMKASKQAKNNVLTIHLDYYEKKN
jgi:hypothetical protein